jgi:hypothetical protein
VARASGGNAVEESPSSSTSGRDDSSLAAMAAVAPAPSSTMLELPATPAPALRQFLPPRSEEEQSCYARWSSSSSSAGQVGLGLLDLRPCLVPGLGRPIRHCALQGFYRKYRSVFCF